MKPNVDFLFQSSNTALRVFAVIVFSMVAPFGSAQESLSNGNPPFLQFGQTLSERKDNLRDDEFSRYQDAFRKFPIAENCVVTNSGKTEFESATFLWKQMYTLEQVNWCVFLVAVKLQSVQKLEKLFIANGLKPLKREQDERIMRFYQYDGSGFAISVTHSLEGRNRPLRWWTRLFAYGYSIGIVTTTDGMPLSVRSTLLIL